MPAVFSTKSASTTVAPFSPSLRACVCAAVPPSLTTLAFLSSLVTLSLSHAGESQYSCTRALFFGARALERHMKERFCNV